MARNPPSLAAPSFGAVLKDHRFALGITQRELGDVAHISRELIAAIESGRARPSPLVVATLADYLGLTDIARTNFLACAHATMRVPPPGCRDPLVPVVCSRPPPLPLPLTPLIGRGPEMARLLHRLQHPAVRLVTLTGPPGVGKTRVALAGAQAALDQGRYPDGVVFVSLAAVGDPTLVVPTIAQALGLPSRKGLVPDGRLVEALRPGRRLLVLDNFEQVLPSAPALAALLAAAPGLQILVTSREALQVYGEHVLLVPALAVPEPRQGLTVDNFRTAVPEPRQGLTVDNFRTYEAVELFVQRAQAVQPDFALTEANAAAIAALCAQLDGLPLAIELAAAQSKFYAPAGLQARLAGQPLALLTRGPCDRPPRQRTWQGAMAWSYDRLTPVEQRVFRRVAIFPAEWTAAAAAVLCPGPPDALGELDAILQALVAKSLVCLSEAGAPGAPQYRLLEPIRIYAWACLQQDTTEFPLVQCRLNSLRERGPRS